MDLRVHGAETLTYTFTMCFMPLLMLTDAVSSVQLMNLSSVARR